MNIAEIQLLRKPSVRIPIVLLFGMLVMLLTTLATVGLVRQADEGTQVHIFQLWLVVGVLMIGFFAIKWWPQAPK